MDWAPVDFLAEVLVCLALWAGLDGAVHRPSLSVAAFHLLNLYPLVWRDVALVIAEMLSIVCEEENGFVDMSVWMQRVRWDIENSHLLEGYLEELLKRNPAAKLLGFFEGVVDSTGPAPVMSWIRDEQQKLVKGSGTFRGFGVRLIGFRNGLMNSCIE